MVHVLEDLVDIDALQRQDHSIGSVWNQVAIDETAQEEGVAGRKLKDQYLSQLLQVTLE